MKERLNEMARRFNAVTQKPAGRELVRFGGLIIVILVFAVWTKGGILSTASLKSIWKQSMFLLIGGAGVVFVMAEGNLNFSIGGVVALSAMMFGVVGEQNPVLGLVTALVTGMVCELLLVGVHLMLKIPAFIVSFAVMFLAKGILSGYTQKGLVALPRVFKPWNTPNLFYFTTLVVLVAAYIVFEYTKIGKYNKAMGANMNTAVCSGVKVGKFKVLAYLICGLCCGIAGALFLIRSSSVTGSAASGLETEILIAMVLGGIPLSGGHNVKMTGIIVGALMLSVLDLGMIMVGLNDDLTGLVKGVVFLAAVAVSYDRKDGQIIA